MITPRTTRLLRTPDPRAFQRAIVAALDGGLAARACALIVPSRGAAEELRRTIEHLLLEHGAGAAMVLPDIVTRGEFYARLHQHLAAAPPLLTDFEREVIFRRAARRVEEEGIAAPFRLRAGLVVEILGFYDELRRRHRTVDDFDRLMTAELAPSAGIDRGAERLLRQTRFLSAAFAGFEQLVADTGRIDEHGLLALLLASSAPAPYAHVIVTVGDQAAETRGLWPVDFDLIARLAGVARVDVVATERILAAGFHERVHDLMPGIEEARAGGESPPPVLLAPGAAPGAPGPPWFVCRDREEELVEVARLLKRRQHPLPGVAHTGIVFQRPLPYLYLARQVFDGARVPWQARDALPLAAEPFAAAVDLVFSFLSAEATRPALVALLSSPAWMVSDPAEGRTVTPEEVTAADRVLRDVKFLGGFDRVTHLADEIDARAAGMGDERSVALWRRAGPAIRAAAAAAAALQPVLAAPAASAQISALLDFIRRHERPPAGREPWHERHLRARGAILAALQDLREAHERHDDTPIELRDLTGTVRRAFEAQTFAPRAGAGGVALIEAAAAPYAHLDAMRIVGLVESDWPERSTRSIFYPSSLLALLGWPSDRVRLAAARARFQDLLRLPAVQVSASTFTLDDDAIVAPSPFAEELESSGLVVQRLPAAERMRIFVHEALADAPLVDSAVTGEAAGWLAVRRARTDASAPGFHGAAGVRMPSVYAVSHLERYLECPFKYFAAHVLRLDEERDDESGLTAQERGHLLHSVFEAFFKEWHASGRRAITLDNVADALALFERVADAAIDTLPQGDRPLERTYLLGSAVAPGLAERAFALEIEHGVEVIDRLIEHALEGAYVFEGDDGPREVRLRAKADRIDLLSDGTMRVVDYKLSRAPRTARALQLPIYSIAAQQDLEGRHGRSWTLGRAGYVAFREKDAFVPLGGRSGNLESALAEGQARLLATVSAIEAGTFPPRPDEPWMCTRCGFPTVCRKDYVGDE